MKPTRGTVHARRALANNIANAFLPLEESADKTAALALRCTATMLDARREAGLAVTEGEDVLKLIHEGCRLAFDAQELFRRAHVQLVPIAERIDVIDYAPECPGVPGATKSPALTVVA